MKKILLALIKPIVDFLNHVGQFVNTKYIRKMKACIEAGEKYIQVNEGDGEFKNLSATRKKKLLKHYRKRFFTYNN